MTQPCEKTKEIAHIVKCVDILKTNWRIFGVVISIVITLCCLGMGLGYKSSVRAQDAQAMVVDKVDKKVDKTVEKVQTLDKAVGKIETSVENIKEDVEDIKSEIAASNKAIIEAIRELKQP